MFQLSQLDLARFEHSHGEGDWHEMLEVSPGHDSSESDPERSWAHGRLYRCSSCADEIRVASSEGKFRSSGR